MMDAKLVNGNKDFTLEQLHAQLQEAIRIKDLVKLKFFKKELVRYMKEYYGV